MICRSCGRLELGDRALCLHRGEFRKDELARWAVEVSAQVGSRAADFRGGGAGVVSPNSSSTSSPTSPPTSVASDSKKSYSANSFGCVATSTRCTCVGGEDYGPQVFALLTTLKIWAIAIRQKGLILILPQQVNTIVN